jgi:hypothetical protein
MVRFNLKLYAGVLVFHALTRILDQALPLLTQVIPLVIVTLIHFLA